MGLGGLGTVRVVSPRGWAHLLHCPQAPGTAQGQTGVCATRGPFGVRVEAPRGAPLESAWKPRAAACPGHGRQR